MTKRTAEPFLWLLFSAGGVLSALFLPVLVLLFGLAFPLGWLTAPAYDQLLDLLRNPLVALVLLAVLVLSLFHWAHRFRYLLFDTVGVKGHAMLVNGACYAVAVGGSFVAAVLLWQVR